MKLMKNSNDSYRVTNCRSGELHTDQTIELEESIKNKLTSQKQLKRRLFERNETSKSSCRGSQPSAFKSISPFSFSLPKSIPHL